MKRLLILVCCISCLCGVHAAPVAQAIWCSGNTTLYFTYDELYAAGNEYKGQTITAVWSGNKVTATTYQPDWSYNSNVSGYCTHVVFDPSFANVRPVSCLDWFSGFTKLTAIEGLNNLNTSEVTSMYSMFANCSSLTSIDLSGFRTAEVTTMEGMFHHCQGLTTLDLSTFRTDKVENMVGMFEDCTSLATIYVSGGWKTANVTSSSDMFKNCKTSTLTTQAPTVVLNDNADNAAEIAYFSGITVNVQLQGRTLMKDGYWNTLCLPFSVTVSGSILDGADVRTLESSSYNSSNSTLTLNFSTSSLSTIDAGKPYLVKWDKPGNYVAYDGANASTCSDIVNPSFTNVTIQTVDEAVATDYVTFTGSFSPIALEANNNAVLYLGADNTLYWPSADMTVGSCRAVFALNGITAGALQQGARNISLNFGDEPSGIVNAEANSSLFTLHSSLNEWYTLDGRRLSGKPTQRGIYIYSGKKVLIK